MLTFGKENILFYSLIVDFLHFHTIKMNPIHTKPTARLLTMLTTIQ